MIYTAADNTPPSHTLFLLCLSHFSPSAHTFCALPLTLFQEYFGITPDVTTMGKVIGGGLPVGAYGGKKEIMEMVAPAGPMYQAGK